MKIKQLTFTRFVAAMLVVVFHIGASSLGDDSVVGSLLSVGSSAVTYFFVLSGFILVVSNVQNGQLPDKLPAGAFWRNRIARIYPLYLFALALTILFGLLTNSDNTNELSTGSVVASALLVQTWWPQFAMQLNYPGWSLSAETLFYGLFPLLYPLVVRQSANRLLLESGLFWAFSLAVHIVVIDAIPVSATNRKALHDLAVYYPPLHLSAFVMGIVTGVIFARYQGWLATHHRWLTVVFAALLGVSLWVVLGHLAIRQYHHNGLFSPLFAIFILWLSTQANALTRWLSRPLPVRLGEISYGVYLLQVPVGMVTFYLNYHHLHWPVWVYVPVYIGLLSIISALCYRGIEQPARRLIRQWKAPALSAKNPDEQLSR